MYTANSNRTWRTVVLIAALLVWLNAWAAAQTAPFPYVQATAYHVLPGTHNSESGYFSLCEGLDGRVYVGAAKYGENSFLVEFDPRTEQQRIVIDTHKLCGLSDKGYAAQAKIHTRNFVGPSGTIYVGSKAGYRKDKDDTAHYAGGYVMSYDPKTEQAKNLGMPKKDYGVIDVVADEARGLLYVVTCSEDTGPWPWMVGDIAGKEYRELGPSGVLFATTLIDATGKGNMLTRDFELAQYDPQTKQVTVRPIEMDGKRWTPPEDTTARIPTWVLSSDAKKAYVILLGDPTLVEIDLTSEGESIKATSHGRMVEGKGFDSRCALALSPDGHVYALVRVNNETGFGTQGIEKLARFDTETKKMEDLGVLALKNPDFFQFKNADGTPAPLTHGYVALPDGTLVPQYEMAMTVARDGTIYATQIYPFTLMKIDQFKLPQAQALNLQ